MGKQHVVTLARDFAVEAHGKQLYRGGPYAEHLDEVAVLVQDYGDVHQSVAYLHHVLDETDADIEAIEDAFGAQIATCVVLLSDDPTYGKLGAVDADGDGAPALVVAAADRLVEVQTSFLAEERGQLRKYRRDHRAFRAAVYREGLAEDYWRDLNELIGI